MTVISVSIEQSEEQVVSGIPKTVALSANIPATIFYTLDGTDPTLFSTIYTSPIHLPYDQLSITLKVMATNGIDFSTIVIEVFTSNILNNTRLSHAGTSGQAQANLPDKYPFGTPELQPNDTFVSSGDASITVDDPALPTIANGFDADGNPTAFTNQPFNLENYSIVYSTTDAQGQKKSGVGNLPADVVIKEEPGAPEETQQFSNMFDPKAMVIFQDATKEDPTDPVQINKQYFTLEDPERARDGNHFFNSGLDTPPTNGSFLKNYYNPRTGMMTYYYFDSWTNRWIISTQPFQPTTNTGLELSGAASAFGGHVYEWLPFTRRVLF